MGNLKREKLKKESKGNAKNAVSEAWMAFLTCISMNFLQERK